MEPMNPLERLWHLLFDHRFVDWSSVRWISAWAAWHPSMGVGFNFSTEIVLPHKANPDNPFDSSWGPEFKLSFGIPWLSVGLSAPNDEWCGDDCELEKTPKDICLVCGVEAEYMMARRCTGCRMMTDYCTCAPAGGHAIGFDGCPSCFGCVQCDYDCCSDCTFDSETEITGDASSGTVSTRYWNEVCNCEGHNCHGLASGILLGSDVRLVGLDEAGRPVPLDTTESGQ